jgi:hypothetical protein
MAGMYRPRHPERTVLYRVLIDHLKLTSVAERPPPPHLDYQEHLMAAETAGEYFS